MSSLPCNGAAAAPALSMLHPALHCTLAFVFTMNSPPNSHLRLVRIHVLQEKERKARKKAAAAAEKAEKDAAAEAEKGPEDEEAAGGADASAPGDSSASTAFVDSLGDSTDNTG